MSLTCPLLQALRESWMLSFRASKKGVYRLIHTFLLSVFTGTLRKLLS